MRLTLKIDRLSKLGEGVGSHAGRAVFVQGAFPGELVEAEVDESQKVLHGALLGILAPSPSRRVPPCELADRCGGCDWLALDERAQRSAKEEIVASALEHLGGIGRDQYQRRPTLSPRQPLGYRRRAVLHPAAGEGRPALGFFGRRSHERIPVERCPALVPALEQIAPTLADPLSAIAKDVETVTVIAEGDDTSFAVQLRCPVKPRHEEAVQKALRRARAKGAVLVPSEGPSRSYGKPALRTLSPLHPHVPLYLRPDGFAQANPEANLGLVTSALYELAPVETDRVLELYSGNGNFSFALAAACREVVAIESSPVGVELAQRSAREGGAANVRFIQGDALKVARQLASEGQRFDRILLDPPRTGASGIAELAALLGARRVVYVACDPAALARDASELRARGFSPLALQLVEMFPQTHHVEAVMSFERSGG